MHFERGELAATEVGKNVAHRSRLLSIPKSASARPVDCNGTKNTGITLEITWSRVYLTSTKSSQEMTSLGWEEPKLSFIRRTAGHSVDLARHVTIKGGCTLTWTHCLHRDDHWLAVSVTSFFFCSDWLPRNANESEALKSPQRALSS